MIRFYFRFPPLATIHPRRGQESSHPPERTFFSSSGKDRLTVGIVKLTIFLSLAIALSIGLGDVHAAQIHVIAPGEQIGRLVALYGVSEDAILAANPLLQPPLQPGMQVQIPDGAAIETPPLIAAVPPASASPAIAPRSSVADAIALPTSLEIRYNGGWKPPGESSSWKMDCSNTARWIVRATQGVELPRTASGQYESLRQKKRLWRVRPNARALRKALRPGDLLFWEHTYRPVRKPPVTHVMVYLGTDSSGRMQMAGSQGSRGVDTYTFDPTLKMGSYPFFLWFRREGSFVAYGRP